MKKKKKIIATLFAASVATVGLAPAASAEPLPDFTGNVPEGLQCVVDGTECPKNEGVPIPFWDLITELLGL